MVRRFRCSTLRPEIESEHARILKDKEQPTSTRYTNDSIGVRIHLQKLQDLFHILKLLLLADVIRLPKENAETKGFSNGAGLEVEILLLDITSLSLERDVSLLTVNEHLTSNYTHSNTGGQDVKQRGFTGTRYTLYSG